MERINKVKNMMKQDQIDAFVVTRNTDIRYLSGFTGDEGTTILVITEQKQFLITDRRFITQAGQETQGYEVIEYRTENGLFGEAYQVLTDLQIKTTAVDMSAISYSDFQDLSGSGKLSIANVKPYLAELRKIKSDAELLLIRKACKISDDAFASVLNVIKEGMTELEILGELEYQFFKRGGDGIAFPTIIASGPVNGANCHATASHRKVQRGDFITMDFGCTYEGYCSDITRTIALGKPDSELVKIYDLVKAAKKDAQDVLCSGASLKAIDAACKTKITAAGYAIPHGIGHSFGYDIHENPFISPKSDDQMECNVVHTLEPGVYIPGLGGVRIEDDYLIREDGAEQLTHCDDTLIIL